MENRKSKVEKCIICGKEISEKRIKQGKKTCSGKCQQRTPEYRQKCSEATKERWKDRDFREKITCSIRQTYQNPELKQKMSEKLKQVYENQEIKQKISLSLEQYWSKEEHKQKQSEVLKNAYMKNPEIIQKRNQSIRNAWSDSKKQKHSENLKLIYQDSQIRQNMSEKLKQIYKNPEIRQKISNTIKNNWLNEDKRASMLAKTHETMKQNNSYGKSSSEDYSYQLLLTKFIKEDIECQYFDKERYPYNCDFYIKSLDLFIECHYGWHHNGRPFDKTSQSDLDELAFLQEKAKTSDNYKNKIYQWTDLDVRKRQCAKDNKLNWIAFYSVEEFNKWYNNIK